MKKRVWALFCLLSLLLCACSSSPDPVMEALTPPEEDRLVVYTSHKEEVYGPIVKEFADGRMGGGGHRRHQRAFGAYIR